MTYTYSSATKTWTLEKFGRVKSYANCSLFDLNKCIKKFEGGV